MSALMALAQNSFTGKLKKADHQIGLKFKETVVHRQHIDVTVSAFTVEIFGCWPIKAIDMLLSLQHPAETGSGGLG